MRLRRKVVNFLLLQCRLRHLSGSRLQSAMRSLLDELDVQRFKDGNPAPAFPSRGDMYSHLLRDVVAGAQIDYLEFGVYRGESLRAWLEGNKHRGSRFFGFDSFEGLPEDWRKGQPAGYFGLGGTPPLLEDPRLEFIKGWFSQTVPSFCQSFRSNGRLIVHLDADLYSSTILPLLFLDSFIRPGTLLIFDEFYDRDNEFRAFNDYLRVSRRNYRVVCEVGRYSQVCMEILG